ncbi:MAG: hypothetical protein ABR954_04820 [Dehalococcoidales bacterium]
MIREICSVIDSRKVISFYYRGDIRFVEPFCYGLHKSSGNEVLRGYQIKGFSEFGEPFGWKLYLVNEISKFVITDNNFRGDRKDYNPNDPMMKKIICRIEGEKPQNSLS